MSKRDVIEDVESKLEDIMGRTHNSFPVTQEHIDEAMEHFDDAFGSHFEMSEEESWRANYDEGYDERLLQETFEDVQDELDSWLGTTEVFKNGVRTLKIGG